MQTNFTPEQLRDPHTAEAERILRRCVHCGLCTATCSTYVLLGDERDSPRGRIYLMKDMFEKGSDAPAEVTHHIDRCLSCLSCMTTCPGGVDYMHLVDLARVHIHKTGRRSLKDRLMREVLAQTVPYPGRFRIALRASALGRPFKGIMTRLGLKELVAMLDLAPKSLIKLPRMADLWGDAAVEPTREVLMLAGCAQPVLRPEINSATSRVLARRGIRVTTAPNAGCCGALVLHMGREEQALAAARNNIDAWMKLIEERKATAFPIEAILITASGCGTTVKDYGHMLKSDPAYADKAAQISAMTKDITEYLADIDLGPPARWSSLKVAYHSACSMQHGQRITDEPKLLLKKAGYTVVDIPEGHICCGSAGTYNILQPEIAGQLRDRKVNNIKSVRPDLVAAGNIGCITQLAGGLSLPIIHTIELIDWAYGGAVPRGLEAFKDHATDVPKPRRSSDDYIAA